MAFFCPRTILCGARFLATDSEMRRRMKPTTIGRANLAAGTGERAMEVKSGVDAVLERAADAGEVPGVVALAADDDGVVYQGAFGKREMGKEADMTLDTVFWIASMTKAVTSVAAMQLVEQGKLHLDEPMSSLIP